MNGNSKKFQLHRKGSAYGKKPWVKNAGVLFQAAFRIRFGRSALVKEDDRKTGQKGSGVRNRNTSQMKKTRQNSVSKSTQNRQSGTLKSVREQGRFGGWSFWKGSVERLWRNVVWAERQLKKESRWGQWHRKHSSILTAVHCASVNISGRKTKGEKAGVSVV